MLFPIYSNVWKTIYHQLYNSNWDDSWQKAQFKTHLIHENLHLIFADDILIGYIEYFRNKIGLQIEKFDVITEWQRKGFGSQVLSLITNDNLLISELYVEVHKNNIKSISFYEKNNFVYMEENNDCFLFIKKL